MTSMITIFLDAMILRFAVAEEPATTKQTIRWGDCDVTLDISTTAPRTRLEGWIQYEIDCLPQIAELVRCGQLEPCINNELRLEVACLKFGGLVASELSVFHGIRFRALHNPFPYSRIVASAHHSSKELDDMRESVFASDFDRRFNDIKQAAGGNKNADAFHILSAERAAVDYFVTTDKALINSLRNQQRVQLALKLVYPSELLHDVCGWPPNPSLLPVFIKQT
jgi:hypothetical protein